MNKNILVVDDEVGYREFYKYMLEPLGYHVETAEDGLQGYEMALKMFMILFFWMFICPK